MVLRRTGKMPVPRVVKQLLKAGRTAAAAGGARPRRIIRLDPGEFCRENTDTV
jgi:hypothetical protein